MALGRSLVGKLLTLIFLSVIVVAVVNFAVVGELSSAMTDYESVLMKEDIPDERAVTELVVKFKKQVQEWKNVLLRGHDDEQREKYWGRFKNLEAEIQSEAAELLVQRRGQPGASQLQDFLEAHKDMAQGYQAGYDAFVASGYIHTVGDAEVKGIDRAPTKTLEEAAKIIGEVAEQSSNAAVTRATDAVGVAIPLLLMVTVLAVAAGFFALRHFLTTPFKRLQHQLSLFGEGDFSERLHITTRDEFEEISNDVNRVADYVHEMMSHLKNSAKDLDLASKHMTTNADNFAQNTAQSRNHLDATASALELMSSISEKVADNSDASTQAASSADDSAKSGLSVMQQTASDIATLADNMRSASDVVQSLDTESESIGKVLDVIRGIAEQTNLLALNAAIEAARAGELGRGFAVVADEVRELANRTQNSISEIQVSIESLQGDAKKAVSAIEVSRSQTDVCVEQTQTAQQSLLEITKAVSTILHTSEAISESVATQRKSTEETNKHVEQTLSVTESTEFLSQEQNAAAQGLKQDSEKLLGLTSNIKLD